MSDPSDRKCPKCGARLKVERADHHLTGQEKLICPLHGSVGRFDDDRRGVYGRHREEIEDEDD